MGAAAIAGIYVLYVRMTARGSPAKLALVVAGMAGWFFVSFAMPPYMITLFGAGDTNPIRISRQFVKLPAEEVTRFLQHAPSLTRRLSTVLGLPDSPDSLAYDIRQMPTDEIERRLSGWRMFHTYGSDSTQADRIAVVLRTWPRDELRCLLRASPRFRARLGTQLGLGSAARPASMVDKIRRITPESLVARLGSMGTWEPPPSLGVLATPWRRITSWWRMWGLLIGERSELLDESGPYWRTLDHLFRGFFAMEHGGWVGQGMGIGFPVFVPKAINDFMYAALCEELGWLGAAAILLLYTALIWTIVVVGQHSTNNYWRLVTINFAILFWAQVFVNVGGVVGFIPLTGIPLPFISRGFISMLTSFTALGILVGISHGSAEATKRKG